VPVRIGPGDLNAPGGKAPFGLNRLTTIEARDDRDLRRTAGQLRSVLTDVLRKRRRAREAVLLVARLLGEIDAAARRAPAPDQTHLQRVVREVLDDAVRRAEPAGTETGYLQPHLSAHGLEPQVVVRALAGHDEAMRRWARPGTPAGPAFLDDLRCGLAEWAVGGDDDVPGVEPEVGYATRLLLAEPGAPPKVRHSSPTWPRS
jgi:hypothetical protein